jgi:hypothetical protein
MRGKADTDSPQPGGDLAALANATLSGEVGIFTIGSPPRGELSCDTSSSNSEADDEGNARAHSASEGLHRPVDADMMAGIKHKIIVEASSGPVRWFELPKSSFCVGSGESNEVRVQGQGANVAAAHVKVDYRAGILWVTDLGSNTGTFVDSARLPSGKPHGLAGSGRVRLGPDLTLNLRVERTKSRAPKRRNTQAGDTRGKFVDSLETAVFKRRTAEMGNVKELAEERRTKPRRKRRAKYDEFGRKARSSSSESVSDRSRSRSYSGGRDHDGGGDGRPERTEHRKTRRENHRSRSRSASRFACTFSSC